MDKVPEEIFTDKIEYTADFNPNLFDTDGKMILICVYGDERFSDEITRLQALSKTIENDDEEYTLASGGPYCDCGYKRKR